MFKNKQLEYVEHAFEYERASYKETIEYLHDRVRELEGALEGANNAVIGMTGNTVNHLEVENARLRSQNEQLEAENERLQKELEQCGNKLNATQYKEYKRLKQKEYNQRYLKKKAQKSSK